jgi:hypothetical protein
MDNDPPVKKGSLCMAPMRREPCARVGRDAPLGAVTPLAPRGHEPGPLAIRSRKLAIRLLLEHEHIYTDWNIDQLADTLREILDSESER